MRAGRLISILLLLQVHRRLTARDLASKLEVSQRTVLRDMDALSASGFPVMAERGAGGGWSLLEGYQTKLTGLNPAEVQALFLMHPRRLMADLGLSGESEAALMKLEASLPASSRRQAELARKRIHIDLRGWRDPGESISSLPVLLEALWREQRLRFLYNRFFDQGAHERIVDPLGLVAKGSVWYLIALVDEEPRTYRVSRISEAAVLDEPSKHREDFDLAAYWDRSAKEFRAQLPRYYATFLVKPSVMHWVRYRGWRLEEELPVGDEIRVRLRFDAMEEALQFALSFGGNLQVLEPVELREYVRQGAAAILRRYEEVFDEDS